MRPQFINIIKYIHYIVKNFMYIEVENLFELSIVPFEISNHFLVLLQYARPGTLNIVQLDGRFELRRIRLKELLLYTYNIYVSGYEKRGTSCCLDKCEERSKYGFAFL